MCTIDPLMCWYYDNQDVYEWLAKKGYWNTLLSLGQSVEKEDWKDFQQVIKICRDRMNQSVK